MLTSVRWAPCVVLLSMLIVAAPARGADAVDALGDAYIAHDSATGTWTLGAGGATLALLIDSTHDYQLVRLLSASGRNWIQRAQPDTAIVVNGVTLPFGSRTDGFEYQDVSTSNDGQVLRLDATFLLRSANLLVTRHVAIADGTPTFEVWTTFQAINGQSVAVGDINAFQFIVPAGTIHSLTGHQATDGDAARDSAFKQQQQSLAVGQTLALGAQGRSSEQTVPWLAVDGAQDEFYAGLMWSGGWSFTANRLGTGLSLSWGLAPMSTQVGAKTVDGAHAIFGVARGAMPEASAALGSYVLKGIREGRPLAPLVTYNTWFAYGTNVDEPSMRQEIANAAALGAELFVIDAGWYVGADTVDTGDFDQGLGSWEAGPRAIPERSAAAVRLRAQPRNQVWHLDRTRTRQPLHRRQRRRGRIVAGDLGGQLRFRRFGADLPGQRGGPAVGRRPADASHRRGPAGLPEMGQQPVGELRPVRARPRQDGRKLRPCHCPL